MKTKKISDKMLPPVRIEPGTSQSTLSFLMRILLLLPMLCVCEKLE